MRNRPRCGQLAHLHREVGANGARLSAERLVGNDERAACPQTLRDPVANVLGNLDALERIGGARRGLVQFRRCPGLFLVRSQSWWRSATISASREARDLKSLTTTHEISLSTSLMSRSIAQFAALR